VPLLGFRSSAASDAQVRVWVDRAQTAELRERHSALIEQQPNEDDPCSICIRAALGARRQASLERT